MTNTHKKLLMLCFLLLGCAATSFIAELKQTPATSHPQLQRTGFVQNQQETAKSSQGQATIKVHVSGAVMEPGVYTLPAAARAEKAIEAAGGMTEQADAARVNLARKLKDGMQVYVPLQRQYRTKSAKGADSASGAGRVINVNTASAAELESLPGIGPAMANRIIAQRSAQPFAKVEDLLRVRGIGPAKLAALRQRVRVN